MSAHRTSALGFLWTIPAILLVGCASHRGETPPAPSPPAPVPVVEMVFQSFDPETVTIHSGQTVEWHNITVLPHWVVDDPAAAANPADVQRPAGAEPFNSGEIPWRGKYRHTFTVPGTYKYICTRHENMSMTGTIIVLP